MKRNIRLFMISTTVVPMLSSTLLYPFVWRAFLVALATSLAVYLTFKRSMTMPTEEIVLRKVFNKYGVIFGLSVGAIIAILAIAWKTIIPKYKFDVPIEQAQQPLVFAGMIAVTLCHVLGLGWWFIMRRRWAGWLMLIFMLLLASAIRGFVVVPMDGELGNISLLASVYCFGVGSLPFAMLWMVAAFFTNPWNQFKLRTRVPRP